MMSVDLGVYWDRSAYLPSPRHLRITLCKTFGALAMPYVISSFDLSFSVISAREIASVDGMAMTAPSIMQVLGCDNSIKFPQAVRPGDDLGAIFDFAKSNLIPKMTLGLFSVLANSRRSHRLMLL